MVCGKKVEASNFRLTNKGAPLSTCMDWILSQQPHKSLKRQRSQHFVRCSEYKLRHLPPKGKVQDFLYDLFLSMGTIALSNAYFSTLIDKESFQQISNNIFWQHVDERRVPFVTLSYHPIMGQITVFNPSPSDECPSLKKRPRQICENPICLKIHKKIKKSLYSQVIRLDTHEKTACAIPSPSPSEGGATPQNMTIRVWKWNPKKEVNETFTLEDLDPRISAIYFRGMYNSLETYKKYVSPNDRPFLYALLLAAPASQKKDYMLAKKYLEKGEKRNTLRKMRKLSLSVHGENSFLYPLSLIRIHKMRILWNLGSSFCKNEELKHFYDALFLKNREYSFYGHVTSFIPKNEWIFDILTGDTCKWMIPKHVEYLKGRIKCEDIDICNVRKSDSTYANSSTPETPGAVCVAAYFFWNAFHIISQKNICQSFEAMESGKCSSVSACRAPLKHKPSTSRAYVILLLCRNERL